jgi:hypothetical protein
MLEGTRVRVKNAAYTYAIIPGLDPTRAQYLEFFINKAGQLIQKNVLGKQEVVSPPYDLEYPSDVGQVYKRVN